LKEKVCLVPFLADIGAAAYRKEGLMVGIGDLEISRKAGVSEEAE
jgi:hypothetical protein